MTPDLKRLCEAAWKAENEGGFNAGPGGDSFDTSYAADRAYTEAIVRAVLMELREVSEAMLDTVDGSLCLANDEQILSPWRSMIDHILSEPAEA